MKQSNILINDDDELDVLYGKGLVKLLPCRTELILKQRIMFRV